MVSSTTMPKTMLATVTVATLKGIPSHPMRARIKKTGMRLGIMASIAKWTERRASPITREMGKKALAKLVSSEVKEVLLPSTIERDGTGYIGLLLRAESFLEKGLQLLREVQSLFGGQGLEQNGGPLWPLFRLAQGEQHGKTGAVCG